VRMTQNNPLRSQYNRVNVDLWMVDLLLDEQFNLLTRPENPSNIRWDVSQDQNLPASYPNNG
jgi:hypothetical protein